MGIEEGGEGDPLPKLVGVEEGGGGDPLPKLVGVQEGGGGEVLGHLHRGHLHLDISIPYIYIWFI